MQDRLELAARARVLEDEVAHRGAVERAVRADEPRAEGVAQLCDRRAPRSGERARDLVGIDHRRSQRLEARRDRGLARADAAREADRDHTGKWPSQAITASRPQTSPAMPPSAR